MYRRHSTVALFATSASLVFGVYCSSAQAHRQGGECELGASIGYSIMETGQHGAQSNTTHFFKDNNNMQWAVHAAYWWQLEHHWQWGMQLSYQHLGNSDAVDGNSRPVRASQVADYLLGLRYYTTPYVALQAKLGIAHQWLNLGRSANTSHRYAFNPEWQLGVLYDINQTISAELTINRIVGSAVGSKSTTNPASMAILAGLNWRLLTQQRHHWQQRQHGAGLELGAALGYGILDTGQDDRQLNNASDHKDYNNLQWAMHAAYWWPLTTHWQWGMHLGYQHLGNSEATKNNTHRPVHAAQIADYLLGLRYYVAPRVALQAELGIAHQWLKLGQDANISYRFALNPEWQLGVLYDMNNRTSAELAINHIQGTAEGGAGTLNPASMALLVGLNWRLIDQKQVHWHTQPQPTGLEFGVDLGYNIIDTGQKSAQSKQQHTYKDQNNLQWGVHTAYWWAITTHWQWGVQLGYQHLGNTHAENPNIKPVLAAQVANTLLALRYYATPRIALQAQLGIAHQWLKLGRGAERSYRFAFNPEWQLGVHYDINQAIGAEFLMDRVAGSAIGEKDARNPASAALLIGLNWRPVKEPWVNSHRHQRRYGASLEIGANLGYSIMDTGQHAEQETLTYRYKNYSNLQWGLHAAYWWPFSTNWQWGMQLGYQHLGNAYAADNNGNTRSVLAMQVANYLCGLRYYAAPRIALQTKLGIAHQWLKLQNNPDISHRFAFNPEWQLGVLYDINAQVGAELMVNRLAGSARGDKDTRNPASMGILFGLNWQLLS